MMLFMVMTNLFSYSAKSQEIDSTDIGAEEIHAIAGDTIPVIISPDSAITDNNLAAMSDTIPVVFIPDSAILYDFQQIDSLYSPPELDSDSPISPVSPILRSFKPNPNKAILYSAIFPGLGQIYNRKYWKVPFVYGGFMGFSYAVMWNNKNLQDCTVAYKDLTYDMANYADERENWHQSWQNFLSAGVDPASRFNENFKTQLKRWRDYYRRNRDLSIILTAGFYLICMADAYVDAQLFDFDISPDLSLHIEPVFSPQTSYSPRIYGFNCSIKF
jgi:hypothetical protein